MPDIVTLRPTVLSATYGASTRAVRRPGIHGATRVISARMTCQVIACSHLPTSPCAFSPALPLPDLTSQSSAGTRLMVVTSSPTKAMVRPVIILRNFLRVEGEGEGEEEEWMGA